MPSIWAHLTIYCTHMLILGGGGKLGCMWKSPPGETYLEMLVLLLDRMNRDEIIGLIVDLQ